MMKNSHKNDAFIVKLFKKVLLQCFFLFKNIPDTIYIQKIWLGAMFTA